MQPARKTILMIDDSAELIDAVRPLFDPKEFFFVSAKDGAEGLFKTKNQKFDVVICDIRMPRMDGVIFVREFRRQVKEPTPVLIYSGHMDDAHPIFQDNVGVYRLNKPAQGYELLQKVRSLANGESGELQTKGIRVFEAGAFLFKEGETGSSGFLVQEGEVEILKDIGGQEAVIDSLLPSEFIGSLVPQDGHFRFFSARAKTACTVVEFQQAQMQQEVENKADWFKAMVRGAHNRLMKAYQTLRKMNKAA